MLFQFDSALSHFFTIRFYHEGIAYGIPHNPPCIKGDWWDLKALGYYDNAEQQKEKAGS